MKRLACSPILWAIALFWQKPEIFGQTTCTITVTQSSVPNAAAKKLLGTSFDARSSLDFDPGGGTDPVGYHDPATGALLPEAVDPWGRVPLNGVRYPGNAISFNWNWSYTIGPLAGRTPQLLAPGLTQSLAFGFDEFMDMVAGKGLPTSDVQIMVNIYPSTGQSNPGTLAADWVEYCNAPDNGSNPRGGTDWAALRASYGHPAPYAVRIWNIGNEPWSPGEFGSTSTGANNYVTVANPIVDSMLLVDPTIDITIPAVGNGSSAWNSTILSSVLVPKIYGLSPHAFYDEDATTGNPTVAQVQTLLSNLAGACAALGLKVVNGDQAHFAPTADPDKAVRWEGALVTADYLLMVSQLGNIELSNFWIYGNVKAVWHPIKEVGTEYRLMAVGQVYEAFSPLFADKSMTTAVTNPSGGPVSKVRAAAFKKNNASQASVIVVNTDGALDHEAVLPVLSGFTLVSVKKMTAPSLASDTATTTTVAPLGNGNYSLPHGSILLFQFLPPSLATAPVDGLRAMPVADGIRLDWAGGNAPTADFFEIERAADGLFFKKIGEKAAGPTGGAASGRLFFLDENPMGGANFYRIATVEKGGGRSFSKIVEADSPLPAPLAFPNPTCGQLAIRSARPLDRLLVKNTLGSTVLSIGSPGREIDLSVLPNGAYLLEFWAGDGPAGIQKLIKN